MDSSLVVIGLPIALGIIMFGLGLSLTVNDFMLVRRHPRAILIALGCQLLVLPTICFGIVVALDLPPLLGIGMMLLAASPGGTAANLFSHLFRGDVALNVALTAANSVIAIFTLPIITNIAIDHFGSPDSLSLQFRKVVEVFLVVLIPVLVGMLVKFAFPSFADRADKPVRIASAVILAVLVVVILVDRREDFGRYFAGAGLATALFCAASLTIGYAVPKAFGVSKRQAIASSMEIGVHNSTLAIYIAIEVLDNAEISVPAAVYSLFMVAFASAWGYVLTRRRTVAAN